MADPNSFVIYITHTFSLIQSLVSAVGSVSRLAFESWQVRFLGLALSFTSCQLLVKG